MSWSIARIRASGKPARRSALTTTANPATAWPANAVSGVAAPRRRQLQRSRLHAAEDIGQICRKRATREHFTDAERARFANRVSMHMRHEAKRGNGRKLGIGGELLQHLERLNPGAVEV